MTALLSRIRAHLREDWRRAAKAWSTWVAGAGVLIWGILTQIPGAAAAAWSALPPDLRQHIPYADKIAWFLFIAIFVLRFVRQGKPDA